VGEQNPEMAYKFEPWRERLRAAIVLSGMKRRELSLKAGLKEGYVRDLIAPSSGKKPSDPSVENLHAIVNALDLTLDDLFEEGELNTNDLKKKMAHAGLRRLFSQIADLSPNEQLWVLGALEQQLQILDKIPNKKPLKSNVLRMRRQDDE
jgi:transcriptional regulator with XRE-family HTH domain